MKKLVTFIIILVSFFSIVNFVSASEGEISEILELETGIQASDLDDIYIKSITLNNSSYKSKYTKLKSMDKVIKKEILRKIANEEFTYYQGFDVINSYSNFIYSVNRLFTLYKYKESGNDVDSSISDTLFEIKTHYKRLQYLVNK
ncbi:hypothetical protein EOM39_02690 [Candidatus Gracilibacteria bacterium]|nr:hypothetical protein [Candidatus Gracilibacteria bacterium]